MALFRYFLLSLSLSLQRFTWQSAEQPGPVFNLTLYHLSSTACTIGYHPYVFFIEKIRHNALSFSLLHRHLGSHGFQVFSISLQAVDCVKRDFTNLWCQTGFFLCYPCLTCQRCFFPPYLFHSTAVSSRSRNNYFSWCEVISWRACVWLSGTVFMTSDQWH